MCNAVLEINAGTVVRCQRVATNHKLHKAAVNGKPSVAGSGHLYRPVVANIEWEGPR